MNAHTLRKWSPIKLLMYLWLPIYILLIFWCQGALTMHLTSHNHQPLFQTTHPSYNYTSSTLPFSSSSSRAEAEAKAAVTTATTEQTTTYSSFAKSHYSDSFERQIKEDTTNWVTKDTSISLLNTTRKTIGTTTITRTTGPYNQIPEQRTYFDTNSNRSNEQKRGGKIILSYSFDDNNNKNNSSSNRVTRSRNSGNSFDDSILDYEESHLQTLWQSRLKEKRARMMAHRRQRQILKQLLANHKHNDNVRSEKEEKDEGIITIDNGKDQSDSLIGNNNYLNNVNLNIDNNNNNKFNGNVKNELNHQNSLLLQTNGDVTSVVANRNRRESRNHFTVQHMPQQHQHQHSMSLQQQQTQHQNLNHRSRPRRYCSAKDPRTLSFEAPTVFEGKIKSMSSDRRTNFSVTFEIIKIYKQPQSQKLPQNVRLQFSYRNYSECDIYREEFRQRGFVRDELEQGKIYFLFVKQMNLGNFSILGQPIKKTKRAVNDVLIGVSENYGEFISIDCHLFIIVLYCYYHDETWLRPNV